MIQILFDWCDKLVLNLGRVSHYWQIWKYHARKCALLNWFKSDLLKKCASQTLSKYYDVFETICQFCATFVTIYGCCRQCQNPKGSIFRSTRINISRQDSNRFSDISTYLHFAHLHAHFGGKDDFELHETKMNFSVPSD